MTQEEKILAIQKLLEDNRWSFWIDNRSEKALELAKELKNDNWEFADIFINSISEFRWCFGNGDWRYFRMWYNFWWYEWMDILHWLNSNTIQDKSNEFKKIMELCESPEYRFNDFNN